MLGNIIDQRGEKRIVGAEVSETPARQDLGWGLSPFQKA